MNVKFDIGDWIKRPDFHSAYVVDEIDRFTEPIPKYYLHMIGNPKIKFWDYCVGWKRIKED